MFRIQSPWLIFTPWPMSPLVLITHSCVRARAGWLVSVDGMPELCPGSPRVLLPGPRAPPAIPATPGAMQMSHVSTAAARGILEK